MILSPQEAFAVMLNLPEPERTLTLLAAGTGLRTSIIGLGCAGALPTLQKAVDFVRANPGRQALMLAVEICSACCYVDNTLASTRNRRTGGSHPRMESFPLVQNAAKCNGKRAKKRRLLDAGAPQLRKGDTGNQIFALKFMEKNWFDD